MSQAGTLNSTTFPPGSVIQTVTGNAGGVVGPDGGDNINILGGGTNVVVTGNPGTNTLTITLGNALAINTNIVAGGTITAGTFATSAVAQHISITGNAITAAGTDPDIDITLASKGQGSIDTVSLGGLSFRGIAAGFVASIWITKQASVQTFNATPTNIVSIVVPTSHMVSISALINGFQDDFTDCVGGTIVVTAYRSSLGNVTLVGAPIINVNYTDLIDTSDIEASIDVPSQTVRLQVVGVAAQTWNWVTTYSYMFTVDNT